MHDEEVVCSPAEQRRIGVRRPPSSWARVRTGSAKACAARIPARRRIPSGFRRGTCAAAAGLCRSRRFPWSRLAENGRPEECPWPHSTQVALLECSGELIPCRRPSFAPARRPQSRTARRRHPAPGARADPGRRRLGQDPRPDHAHRLADPDRPAVAGRRDGRDLHQQGGQGDADAARRHARHPRARHVGRHLPCACPNRFLLRALEVWRLCRKAFRSSIRAPTSSRPSSASSRR